MNVVQLIKDAPLWSQPPLAIVSNIVVFLALVFIVGAVVIDFRNYHRQSRAVVRSESSFVETGSMSAFFVAYYLVIRFRWLEVGLPSGVRTVMILAGLLLVVVGVAFNVWGRVVLKSSWANQIKIYEGHRLLTTGPFALVRHPLYASLIWICIGGSLVYSNALSALVTFGVFVPMMYVRAKKEDTLLLQTFGDAFTEYTKSTGMFVPRVGR